MKYETFNALFNLWWESENVKEGDLVYYDSGLTNRDVGIMNIPLSGYYTIIGTDINESGHKRVTIQDSNRDWYSVNFLNLTIEPVYQHEHLVIKLTDIALIISVNQEVMTLPRKKVEEIISYLTKNS